MLLKPGDRVRVISTESAYTGCRGSIAPGPEAAEPGSVPLGYYVAIDGENGVTRPFLTSELERLTAARVASGASAARRHAGRG